jgi:hypothetical protein
LPTRIKKETDKELHFLTNNFRLAASTIAAIYKARWQQESLKKPSWSVCLCLTFFPSIRKDNALTYVHQTFSSSYFNRTA